MARQRVVSDARCQAGTVTEIARVQWRASLPRHGAATMSEPVEHQQGGAFTGVIGHAERARPSARR
jgi:hypothetical protein